MPADPRLLYNWDELDDHMSTIPVDGTINLPVISVLGETQSTSLGLAVALVNAGLANPQVGLGASGNELYGKIKTVAEDGSASVQDRGYMTFGYVATTPVPGVCVGVDGTGKVLSTPANKQAVCVGFMTDPFLGTTVCIVKKN